MSNIEILLRKLDRSFEEHLSEALQKQTVKDSYEDISLKRPKENPQNYIKRVVKEAASHQFVRSVFGGKEYFVSFGVSGPIIVQGKRFNLVPAKVMGGKWGIHNFLFYPNIKSLLKADKVFIRIDSGCISGQVFGDEACDCRAQLELSMNLCLQKKAGIVINIPGHDGRGWGEFKMANQRIMHDLNMDTVQAARLFYGSDGVVDQRTYTEAILMLRSFGFNERHQFCLATNNPRKIGAFHSMGMRVDSVRSIVPKKQNLVIKNNLKAKVRHWQHKI